MRARLFAATRVAPIVDGAFSVGGVGSAAGILGAYVAASVSSSGLASAAGVGQAINPAPSASVLAFTAVPSVADERAFYDRLGWARTAGDEAFDFTDLGTIGAVDIHNDTEGDDLWLWEQQVLRGHTAPIATTYRDQWRTYWLTRGVSDTVSSETAFDNDHIYGPGLCLYGVLNNNATALTQAEALGDIAIAEIGGTAATLKANAATQGVTSGGGRAWGRWLQLISWLTWATGKTKWAQWLDALIEVYLQTPSWQEAPTMGIVQGGFYFVPRQTYLDAPNWNGTGTVADYDAGRRLNSTFQLGIHAEGLWRAYLVTGRADVRNRIIKFADFMVQYAHIPAHIVPFTGGFFGHTNGTVWHREGNDNASNACYDASVVNVLMMAYKLTGSSTYLTRARVHYRQATRWNEGEPGSGNVAPQVAANEVLQFADTRRNTGGSRFLNWNKGILQYSYLVFENGGNPPTLDSNVPAYIRNLAAGSGKIIASAISDAFGTTAEGPFGAAQGAAGEEMGVLAYSGSAYDTKRSRLIHSGGGHNNYNGNGCYELRLYDSETPTWNKFKQHTTPPSVTSFSVSSVETAPNGDPASCHTYNQIVYDAYADKLVLTGVAAAAGSNGGSFARFRLLNLTTRAWDAPSASLIGAGGGTSMYDGAFAYDEVSRSIFGRGGQATGRWYRYDCVAGTLQQLTVSGTGSGTPNIDACTALNQMGRYQIFIGGASNGSPLEAGGADMVILNLASLSGSSITATARTLAGFPAALKVGKVACEFHPPSQSFVAWIGGNTLYRLIPPADPFTGTWTFSPITPSGDPLPPNSSNNGNDGVFSKFRWAPYPHDKSRGVFVMHIQTGTSGSFAPKTHIYKPNF